MASATQPGTRFPVETSSTQFPVYVIGMGEAPRLREKTSPKGEATYASGAVLRMAQRDSSLRADKTASVHVIHPDQAGYDLGQVYRAEGRVYVQPYQADSGRLTYSITVERLVPDVEPTKGS